jgi:hypothetical protein
MIVLDEHLQGLGLESEILRWYRGKVLLVKELRPGMVIKDEVIPSLLQQIKQPTFVTINHTDFWRQVPADKRYCIICLMLVSQNVNKIPSLLRRLFSLSKFKTKTARMGKVVLIKRRQIEYYQIHDDKVHNLTMSL